MTMHLTFTHSLIKQPPRQQSGAALLAVYLIVFLAATISVSMVTQHTYDIRRADYNKNFGQGYQLGLGVEMWALGQLHRDIVDDKKDARIDSLDESWTEELILKNINNIANVNGRISDSQAKFNINNLRFESTKSANSKDAKATARAHYLFLRRLLKTQEINPDLANAILDWVDKDSNASFPLGAEDPAYLDKNIPYRTAGRAITHISELRLIKGITDKTFKKLKPLVIALPALTRININTASKKVLLALSSDMTDSMADTIIQRRLTNPFKTAQEFTAFLTKENAKLAANSKQITALISTFSDFYIAHAEVSLNRSKLHLSSMIWRDQEKRTVKVYQRSRRKQ